MKRIIHWFRRRPSVTPREVAKAKPAVMSQATRRKLLALHIATASAR